LLPIFECTDPLRHGGSSNQQARNVKKKSLAKYDGVSMLAYVRDRIYKNTYK